MEGDRTGGDGRGPDERLRDAQAAAPEAAAVLAPRPPRLPGRRRRAAVALGALAAAILLALGFGLAARCRTGAPPAARATGDAALAPLETRPRPGRSHGE
jgi:hypothetical protein